MQPADARSPGGVSFPTHESPARTRASSPTKPETPSFRSPSTQPQRGTPKLGSRSTSFAIVHESPHKSSVPSPLGPGSTGRRRVVTQSSALPRRSGEREPSGFAGDLFGFGGEDPYLGPDDSAVAEDVQRLLESKANRQRTKDSLTSSQGSPASTVRSQIAPPPPQRPFPSKAQTSPAAVPRSLPTSPSKPQTPQHTLRASTSTEALVFYETPTASSSKTTLDWSGYNPPEQTAPKNHRRTFSLTRKQKPPKKDVTSDTGDEADNFEASLKAIRDRTSEGTWSKVSLAKQELASRYGTFYRFLNDYKRAFNPAEVVRWRARHRSAAPLDGLISTASLPSFASATSDPSLLLSLDDKHKNRFRITSPIVHEWLEAEVNPPGAHDLMPNQKTIRGPPIKNRPRGASLSIQQGLDAGAAVGGSPSDSGRRVSRLSQPGTSLDSLKGPLNAMLAGVGRRDRAEPADYSVAGLSKISAAAKRAFRREQSPTRRPGSTVNSDDESGASQHRKVSYSRPPTPDTRQVDSATDDDARSGKSFGHLAKKSLHNLFGMTRDGDKHSHSHRDKLSEMSALQLSPAGSIDGVGRVTEDPKALRGPYLVPAINFRNAATTRSSQNENNERSISLQYRQKRATIDSLRHEGDGSKRFLESVEDSLREYAKLEKSYGTLFGEGLRVIDDHILGVIDFDPFALPPRTSRKPLASTSWRAAEEVAARIRNQRTTIEAFLAHHDQHLMLHPGPELGESLASLLETLQDLEVEREAIMRTKEQVAQLVPIIDGLYDELAREADAVGMLAAQSYGVKTATHLATSPFEKAAARSLEFLLNWFAGLYRSFMTRKRYILPLIAVSAIIVFGTSGWLHNVVLYLWETMIAFVIVLAIALFASALGTFVVRGGFANAPSFAS
ncbi:hypothetical protein AURDEDRAFT_111512 [Auricularia subglabra TFB-10046 SS5]|nr:hypothetical protein AURDEDRAFT_111512 [Auricularia subglabra TFB-10046 SS5]